MQVKPGVDLSKLKIEMRPVLIAADKIWNGLDKDLVITETAGGIHSAGSLHYYGLAIDLRTNYFNEEQKVIALTQLREALGADFDVVNHSTHIHVEYDPKTK